MAKRCLNCKAPLDKGDHSKCRWEYESRQMTAEDWGKQVKNTSAEFDKDMLERANFVANYGNCDVHHDITMPYDMNRRRHGLDRTCPRCQGAKMYLKAYHRILGMETVAKEKAQKVIREMRALVEAVREMWPEVKDEIMDLVRELREEGALPDEILQ